MSSALKHALQGTQLVLDDNYAFLSGLVAADFPEGLALLGDVGDETRAVLTAIDKIRMPHQFPKIFSAESIRTRLEASLEVPTGALGRLQGTAYNVFVHALVSHY